MENSSIFREEVKQNDLEYSNLDKVYDECLKYLQSVKDIYNSSVNYKKITQQEGNIETKNDVELEEINKPSEESNDDVRINIIQDIKNNPCVVNSDDIKVDSDTESGVYETIRNESHDEENKLDDIEPLLKFENEINSSAGGPPKSERLRRLSEQLPKIVITQSNTSLEKEPTKPFHKTENPVPIFDVNKSHVSGKIK